MKTAILLLFPLLSIAATKPTSPAFQSGNALSSGLVRYWYVGASTTTITDFSTSAKNLTTVGSPSLTAAPGGVGNELLLNGTTQFGTGNDAGLPNGTASWSIAWWLKTTAISPNPGANIVASWAPGGGVAAQAQFGVGDFSSVGSFTPNSVLISPNGSVEDGTTAVNDGVYHRAMLTYNAGSSTLKIYVDGAFQKTYTVTLAFTPLSGTVTFGAISSGVSMWVGSLGDMAIWNRELAGSDVTSDFTDPWQEVRPPGTPIPGALSKVGLSGLTTVSLTTGVATSGTPPYSYQWQRSLHGVGSFTNVGTNSTSLSDSGLSTGTNYDYQVFVTDNAAQTATSSILTIITLFPVTDSHVTYSPGCWFLSGSAFVSTNNSGAEFRFGFTGTSATLVFDTTHVVLGSSGVAWSVDNGVRTFTTLTNPTILGSGLAAGNHTARYWANWIDSSKNDWIPNGTVPDQMVTIVGIQLDVLATMATQPTVPTDKMIAFGDSITAGTQGGSANGSDSLYSYAVSVSQALNSELSNIGYNSSAWATPAGPSNVPVFASVFGNYFQGQARTLSGVYKRATVNLGRNDSGSFSSTVSSDLTALRAGLGGVTKLYVITTFGGQNAATITSGFTTYCSSTPSHSLPNGAIWLSCANDSSAFLINLGPTYSVGLGGGGPSLQSSDGTHPNSVTQAAVGAAITQTIQQIESGAIAGASASAIIF